MTIMNMVGGGGKLTELTVTPTAQTQEYIPSDGNIGYSKVTVNGVSSSVWYLSRLGRITNSRSSSALTASSNANESTNGGSSCSVVYSPYGLSVVTAGNISVSSSSATADYYCRVVSWNGNSPSSTGITNLRTILNRMNATSISGTIYYYADWDTYPRYSGGSSSIDTTVYSAPFTITADDFAFNPRATWRSCYKNSSGSASMCATIRELDITEIEY